MSDMGLLSSEGSCEILLFYSFVILIYISNLVNGHNLVKSVEEPKQTAQMAVIHSEYTTKPKCAICGTKFGCWLTKSSWDSTLIQREDSSDGSSRRT